MEQFSVIIPTLWYSDKTDKLLVDLIESEYVGEIIIIDNNSGYDEQDLKIKEFDKEKLLKLRILPQKENIYVNPAWNLGVKESKFDNICLCNDDINFSTKIFKYVNEKINDDKVGVIGLSRECYYRLYNKDYKNVNCTITKSIKREPGWGCLLFVKKHKWIEIPNNIKIFYGDDLMYDFINSPYTIRNFRVDGNFSDTVKNKEFVPITRTDNTIYKEYKKKKQ